MTIKKHLSLFLAAALFSATFQPISARQLNVDEAIASAKKDCTLPILRDTRAGGSLQLVHTERNGELSTIYVLNKENGGFIILSADNVGAPVLGYSDTGSFDINNAPDNMQSWLGYYSDEIAYAANNNAPEYKTTATAQYKPIAPLLKTEWNQSAPYNLLCPIQGGVHCQTGCTATAIAQVVRYHSWPEEYGIGTYSYEWNNAGTKETLSFDYAHTRFEWDKMLDRYRQGEYTQEQGNAVATLMYAVGVGADMGYGKDASGALGRNAARGLIENFNFDKGLNYLSRKFYSLEQWTDMVYNDLATNRPVYYDGYNQAGGTTVGHAFVVDGYSEDGFFHLNWGWGGMSNGYFRLTALDPAEQGIGGSAAGYNDNQGAIFGVQRPTDNSQPGAAFCILGNFMPQQKTYTHKGLINFLDGTVNGMFYVSSIFKISNIRPGIKLVGEDNSVKYIWWQYSAVNLAPGTGYTNLEIKAENFPTSGKYTITPVVQTENGVEDIMVAIGKINRVTLEATESELIFTSDYELPVLKLDNIEAKGNFYVGYKSTISATISNTGSEYYGNVYPIVYNSKGEKCAQMSTLSIDLVKGESTTVSWTEEFRPKLSEGKYTLNIVDDNGNDIGDGMEIEIKAAPTGKPRVIVKSCRFPESTGNTGTQNAYMVSRDIVMETTLECTSGIFDYTVYAFVFPAGGGTNVDTAGNKQLYLEAGQTENVTFRNTMTGVQPNTMYFIQLKGYKPSNGTFSDNLLNPDGSIAQYWIYITPEAGVEVLHENDSCTLYPNPAETTITVTAGDPIREIAIYSMDGKQVMSHTFDTINRSEQLDVTAIAAGNYIVRIATASGNSVTRLIKR